MRTGNYRPCEAGQRAHQRIITPQASTSAQTLSRQTETHNIDNTKTKRAKTHNWSTGTSPDYHTPQASTSAQTSSQDQKHKEKKQIHDWSMGTPGD